MYMTFKFFCDIFLSVLEPYRPYHSNLTSGSAISDDFDTKTAALIAKLALDDRTDVLPADSLPLNKEIVHKLQVKQYNEWLSIAEDAKLAKSIGDAFITAEEAAREDRIAAELLSRGEALPAPKSCQMRLEDPAFTMDPVYITSPEIDASNNVILENGLLDGAIDNEWMHGESSNAGPSADHKKRVDCVNCNDYCRDHETFNTPCGHYFCWDCLAALAEAFTRDESLFPLRCCQDPLPIEEVLPNLSLELRTLFQRKHAEYSILPKNRLYCSNSTCSTFLGSSEHHHLSKIECPSCLVNTCPQCKELAHPGEGCGVNASYKALQELAKSQKWQTCPGCHALVELKSGCYHMTCRCRTQFCYLCAAHWKTCGCRTSG